MIKFGLAAQLQSPVGTPRAGEIPYVLNPMQRNTTYTFLKGRLVYELTDPDGNVYVMQSYSQQYEPRLSLGNLPDIGPWLHLPTGWSYASRRLPEDLFLTANGSTQVVLDDFRNAYQINPAAKGRVP